jgi:protein tyrosine/serine phosphatase
VCPGMNRVRANTVALFLALSFTSALAAQSAIHIDNFGQISPTYYRGAHPIGQDYADLAALGIKTVIDLTSDDSEDDESALVKRAGMSYIQIPMTTHKAPTAAQLEQFLALVTDRAHQPVYVHCVGGRHRTGVMTAAYRMMQDRWSADQAFEEMKRYKFGADFLHPEFKKFVYGFDVARFAPSVQTVAPTARVGG